MSIRTIVIKKDNKFIKTGTYMPMFNNTMWAVMQRIKQRGNVSSVVHHLQNNGTILTSLNEISEQFA